MNRTTRGILASLAAILTLVLVTGCALSDKWGADFARDWKGVSATMTTYDENSKLIDTVHGTSFAVERDDRFDTDDSKGESKNDSSVLLISIGKSHISHVGSTLILAQDGLSDIKTDTNTKVDITNTTPGTPWLNNLIERNRNLWKGKAKTLLIRSQNGTPLAVYAGNEVEVFKTDVPKSTQFRVDGKMLYLYKADYTMYDTDLLTGGH